MVEKGQIREGMTVYSAEGDKLGKVISCEESTFVIEKGFFFPKDYVARFDDVAGVSGDDIRLSRGRDALGEAGPARREGTYSQDSSVMGPGGGIETASTGIGLEGDQGGRIASAHDGETVSMPVREEEVEIRKRPVVKEEVRLRKDRVVEQRAAEADVRREEVRVEGEGAAGEHIRRTDVEEGAPSNLGEDSGAIGPTRREPEE